MAVSGRRSAAGPCRWILRATPSSPGLAIVDGRPWVSFIQVAESGPPSAEARVARLTDSGSGWEAGRRRPVAEGTFGDIEPPAIASVAGLPTVAVAVGSTNRIRVFRPTADGDDWQQVGNGPASANGTGPTVADMGGVPWVGWTQGGDAHASRLDGDTWREAGGSVAGSGGVAQLASVNGFPWIAVTRDDGSSSGGPGTPGCCSQARVARLEPDFSALRAFPSSDTATLLSDIDAFGLPYPVGFEYGEERNAGATGATSKTPVRDEFALGEARGLKPSTLYWFSPFTTAGTPLPLVRGERDFFATPPGSGGAAPPPQTTVITGRARLIVAIVRAPTRVRRGGRVRVRVLSSEPGKVQLSVVRRGRVIRRIGRSMRAGTVTLTWRTRRAAPRLYRLRVRVRATDGRAASDAVSLRILRRRSSS